MWMLPQNIIGIIIALATGWEYNERGFFEWNSLYGVSLGWFIFLPKTVSETTLNHEKGHRKQSMMLGWLYLLVIGFPSLLWACYCNTHDVEDKYAFYTERWADRLGGVVRN